MYRLNWIQLPITIQSLFTKIEDLHKCNMRQTKITKLFLPRVSKQMAKTLLSFRGPQHWSLIPSFIKNFSWTTFKKKYRESRMAVRYGTVRLDFCYEVRYAGTVRLFCNGRGMVRWYGTPFL